MRKISFLAIIFVLCAIGSFVNAYMEVEEERLKREQEILQYKEEVKEYSDEMILSAISKTDNSYAKTIVLIEEIGNRAIEKGKPILEKYINNLKEKEQRNPGVEIIGFNPEALFSWKSNMALLVMEFKLLKKSENEIIPFLIEKIKKREPGFANGLLAEKAPQYYKEIAEYLLANKDDVRLSTGLLVALRHANTDKVQPYILEYIKWCRETKRDKNKVTYKDGKKEHQVLIYASAQGALAEIGNKESLKIFKEDLKNSNPKVRAGAVFCLGYYLMRRNVIAPKDIEDVYDTIKNDTDEDVQKNFQQLKKFISIAEYQKKQDDEKKIQEQNQNNHPTPPDDRSNQKDQ